MLAAFKTHFESKSDDDDGLVGEDKEPTYSYEEEEKEFEDEHDDAFGGYMRVSCFAHTLQLVVGKFTEVRSCSSTIKKAHGLVK